MARTEGRENQIITRCNFQRFVYNEITYFRNPGSNP